MMLFTIGAWLGVLGCVVVIGKLHRDILRLKAGAWQVINDEYDHEPKLPPAAVNAWAKSFAKQYEDNLFFDKMPPASSDTEGQSPKPE